MNKALNHPRIALPIAITKRAAAVRKKLGLADDKPITRAALERVGFIKPEPAEPPAAASRPASAGPFTPSSAAAVFGVKHNDHGNTGDAA